MVRKVHTPYKKHTYIPKPTVIKPSRTKTSNYKLKFYGSFFALIFLLSILYGRSKYYTPSKQHLPEEVIDFSQPDWMNRFNKIYPPTSSTLSTDGEEEIKTLVLILEEYGYWGHQVNLARKAKDEKKEKYALSKYRKKLKKITRYSGDAIKKAQEILHKSGWSPETSSQESYADK